MLVVVCGLPGAGKTTVSGRIADRIDGERLRTDVVRKDLLADPAYTEAESRRVYDELFARARERLERGERVVLDGTFHREDERVRARSLADDAGVPFRVVKVECDERVVRERIEAREGDASDADFAVYRTLEESFEPLAVEHVTVDNSGSLAATREQVDAEF